MTILIRGQRLGENPFAARAIQLFTDFSSHNAWGTRSFRLLYCGDLDAFCAELRGKGVSFKIASTHATNPAQKASGQAEEVLPSARHTPPQKRRHPLS